MDPFISVIVPVYREAAGIGEMLERLFELPGAAAMECVVVDGGPQGETLAAVDNPLVRSVSSPRGRGVQMNRGAALARGSVFLFLHADTRLAADALPAVRRTMARSRAAAGAFDLGIDSPHAAFRVIETMASLRSRLTRVPYGDQAIFVRREVFRRLGGYREIPLMEDVDFMRRVRRAGLPITLLKQKVRTSARRWEKEGLVRGTLRNWLLATLFLLGCPAERLERYYRAGF